MRPWTAYPDQKKWNLELHNATPVVGKSSDN
jgi:hypothetical protein